MKNFLYVSKTKLQTYYDQLPNQKPIRAELKTKLISPVGSIGTAQEWAALPDLRKLEYIEKELRARYDFGTVEFPGEWIEDEIDARPVSLGSSTDALLYIGKKENTYVLFLGSAAHVIGANIPKAINLPHSYAPSLIDGLTGAITTCDDNSPAWMRIYLGLTKGPPFFGISDHELSSIMLFMYNYTNGINIRIRFLSLNLWDYSRDKEDLQFLLTSPLYIEYCR